MRNHLIKLFIITFSLLWTYGFANAIIWPNVNLKLNSSWDETYTTSLTNIGNDNTLINLKIVWVLHDADKTYSINMPTGFEYVSYIETWATCTQTINTSTNSNFNYTVTWNAGSPCISTVILTYKITTNTSTWDKTITVLNTTDSTITSTATLWITANYSLINAETQDTNWNWYIDTYKLVFNTSTLNSFDNTNLTIWDLTPTLSSVSWDTAYLSINDSTYKTGEKPKINDDWGIFTWVWAITDITPTDKAAPILETVNWQSKSWIINITADWNIVLKFSEKLLPSAKDYISLKKDWVIISSTKTFWEYDTLTIDPDTSLSAGSYSIVSTSDAKDWSTNSNNLNLSIDTLIVSDTVAPIWQTIWDSTWISINSWNSKTNNISVQLSVLATDNISVSKMKISNLADLSDASWIDYTTDKFNHNIVWTSLAYNTVYVQFQDNEWNTSWIYSDSIYYENTNNFLMFDNIDSVYTNQNTITLNWTCNHVDWHTALTLQKAWANVWTTTCTSWKFSYTYDVSEWENIYKVYYTNDTNIDSTIKIYKDTTAPTLSITPTQTAHNSSITVAISSNDIYDIYYTTDWTAASTSSTKYTWSFNLNSNTTVKYYTIDPAWNEASWTISYTFTCATSSVTNWSVAAYPTCTITCDSWYTLNWSTCEQQSSWGGGWWGWSSAPTSYEWLSTLSTKITNIDSPIDSLLKKDGSLNIENLEWTLLTWENGQIELRPNYRSDSLLTIYPNTSIVWDSTSIVAPYSLSIISDLGLRELPVWGINLRSVYIKSLYFAWDKENTVNFNKDIWLTLYTPDANTNYYVFTSDSVDNNFELFNNEAIITDADGLLNIKTKELWYFLIVKDTYFDRFFSGLSKDRSLEETISYLKENINSSKVIPLIEKIASKLNIDDIEFYTSFDKELNNQYQKVINWYSDLLLYIDKYFSSKDKADLQKAKDWYISFLKYTDLKDFEQKYVTIDWGIYKTNYDKLINPLKKVETIIINKLKKLRDSQTISLEQYNKAISDYNNFVLYLSIFQEYDRNTVAGKRWLEAVTSLMKIYKLKVIEKTTIELSPTAILVKDKYSFTKNLQYWDYNDDVKNLQIIMKSYWYFNYETTGYFWWVTQTQLAKFASEILWISNSNWYFNDEKRQKILELEIK